jgi:ABC-2 type transport system ATP-binding protein
MTATPARTDLAVEIRDLHKSFGAVHALDGLDLTVRSGEVAGFLGPNGAGKSTTIRVLLGLLRADSGTVRLLGGDPWRDAVALHRRLAYVPGDVNLWPNLTGGEAIDLLTRLRGSVDPARRKLLLERFELDPTKKARTYSKGNRQKVALVSALASDVELLVLDEPTSGLDPLMEAVFTECVREVVAEGRSVLLSSHILAEVEKLCDTVTIIRAGKAVQSGTLQEMRHLTRSSVTVVTGQDPTALGDLPGVHDVVVERTDDGPRARFDVDNDQMSGLVAALGAYGVRSLQVAPPSLEELFMRHYGDELARLDTAGAL